MARISKQDAAFLDRFHSGAEPRAYTYFGAHQTRKRTGEEGVTFRVWGAQCHRCFGGGGFQRLGSEGCQNASGR